MSRQFVAVEFKPGGRAYSYHNDGEPLHAGDLVRVLTRGGERTATVAFVDEDAPPFETKPIIGKAEPELGQLFTKEQ